MISSFKGFRGHAALFQLGKVTFIVVAKNQKQLSALHAHIMPDAPPFNPDACQKSIVVQSSLLPKPPQEKQ